MSGSSEIGVGLVVAIETSARPASVAVRKLARQDSFLEGRDVEAVLERDRSHASDLLPALDRLVRELGASPRDIRAVLVGTGPGSYTGLRVGIATALGLARASSGTLRGLPSGETVAWRELRPGEECAVLLDARQGELYFAHYRRTSDEVEVVRPTCVLRPSDLEDSLPPEIPIFGDATVADAAGLGPQDRERLRQSVVPRAIALLELGAARLVRLGAQAPSEVVPLYLRPFAVRSTRR